MRSLRGQFILSHILPFLLILPLAGLVILYLAETQVALVELSDTLEEQAALIAAAVAQQPNVMADSDAAQRFVDDIGRLIDGDFYLLAADGRLLAAENGSDITPETDAVGPGVKAILDGTDPASTVRVSTAYGLLAQSGEAVAPVLNVNEQLIGIVGVRKSISGIAAAFGPLRRLVAFTVLGGALLGMLLGYELAKRLAEPIGRTVDAVERIGRGEQEAALPAGGPTEMRRLTEAVNSLAARLRMLEEMRRRSFANIVHELGRPLGAVLAAVEVLRGVSGDDPAIRAELLAGIHQEIKALEPLLDDMAQLHAEATGSIRLDRRPVALSPWLNEAARLWREAVTLKGLAWVMEIPDNLPELLIDPQRLAQVVGNLISNAVKYTDSGGVAVSAAADAREVRIAVADTGPGIDLDEQPRVFDSFYRGHIPQRTTEGLGVGLAIARSLTEAHGGRLTLDSAPGRGSVFTLHLPREDRPRQ